LAREACRGEFQPAKDGRIVAAEVLNGLSAGVWTEKGSRAMGMAAALRSGVIWDNTFNRFDPTASFGGYKESGFGREGGPSGLAAYLDTDDEVVR
jgi:aldehyde dehydrogenase (NAD+)